MSLNLWLSVCHLQTCNELRRLKILHKHPVLVSCEACWATYCSFVLCFHLLIIPGVTQTLGYLLFCRTLSIIRIEEASAQDPWESLGSENETLISLRSVILILTTPENPLPFHLESWSLLLGWNESKFTIGSCDNQEEWQKSRSIPTLLFRALGVLVPNVT